MSKNGLAILTVGLLAVSSESYAGAWMPYEGEVPGLAVTTANMDGGKEQEGMPVCRYRRTVGWLDVDAGVCHTVGTGKRHKVRTEDFYLLVQSSPDSPEGTHTDPWMPFDTDLTDAFLDGDIEMDLVTTTNHDRGKLQEGMPICRYKRTVGWLDVEAGVCHTVGNGKKHKVRSKDFYVLQHEEAVDNLSDKEEALDNLSDAMEELFATCPHSGYEDISNWHSSRDVPRLVRKRESAREDLDKAREKVNDGQGGARPLLGKLNELSGGGATWNQHGVAGHLGWFISNIGGEDKNSKFTRMAKCGGQGNDEKQELFESFRQLLTDACTAMDGEWKGYTIGNGRFVDQGSYSDWTMGQCK